MTLNSYVADRRAAIFDDLSGGRPPREGSFDPDLLKEAQSKGSPQIGTTRFSPGEIILEFIYPSPHAVATVLVVAIPATERIVFLPVPDWVVENIWQGEVSGSFHLESEADELMAALRAQLTPLENRKWFERQPAKRRE